jgi:hypothetical protein
MSYKPKTDLQRVKEERREARQGKQQQSDRADQLHRLQLKAKTMELLNTTVDQYKHRVAGGSDELVEEWFWVDVNEDEHGPCLKEELKLQVLQGGIDDNCLVWEEAMPDWLLLGDDQCRELKRWCWDLSAAESLVQRSRGDNEEKNKAATASEKTTRLSAASFRRKTPAELQLEREEEMMMAAIAESLQLSEREDRVTQMVGINGSEQDDFEAAMRISAKLERERVARESAFDKQEGQQQQRQSSDRDYHQQKQREQQQQQQQQRQQQQLQQEEQRLQQQQQQEQRFQQQQQQEQRLLQQQREQENKENSPRSNSKSSSSSHSPSINVNAKSSHQQQPQSPTMQTISSMTSAAMSVNHVEGASSGSGSGSNSSSKQKQQQQQQQHREHDNGETTAALTHVLKLLFHNDIDAFQQVSMACLDELQQEMVSMQ